MDEQMEDDQLEPIYNSSVPLQDIPLKTYQESGTIEMGDEKGSGRSVLAARHDDAAECSTLMCLALLTHKS